MTHRSRLALSIGGVIATAGLLCASVTTVPDSNLIPSTGYYTDIIGGGIGPIVVMTGGGANAGVGVLTGRNDDGFSGPINLGFTLNFFGFNQTQFWANNNGNISFGAGLGAFVPMGPLGASQPVISPFFADVDSAFIGGVMHLRTDIPNEIIVTWDQSAYFNEANGNQFDSFQLVLRGPNFTIPSGEGQIGFFYKTMQWEVGNAGDGVNGFCAEPTPPCYPAAIGFGDGIGDGFVLQGSIAPGIAGIVNNHHIWFNLNNNGIPDPAPPPAPVPPATVPTLTTWGMIILACALLLFGVKAAGRRANA
jgi:hypothetical protein